MNIEDIYSQRNKNQNGTFVYDTLSPKLKVQIVHIWSNFYKQLEEDDRESVWGKIHSLICEAHGNHTLLKDFISSYYDSYKVSHYFENNENIEECLDVIEFVFRFILKVDAYLISNYRIHKYTAEKAIKDLNTRFIENDRGFEFYIDKIIKIDSKLLHIDIIKPALNLLNTEQFKNANEEFLSAHEHFKFGKFKECLSDCLKAFESTMKIICFKNKFAYEKNDTSKNLISVLIKNQFIPSYNETQLNAIKQLLESSIPTIRNKNSGHGQGPDQIILKKELASYMLYITGTTIKFLFDIDIERQKKPSH
jgi:hypothetical protein